MRLQRHSNISQRRREQGSILVICMVLAGLGTIGVAAWIALLDARGHQIEANITALQRRAVSRNSKALAYHALYANHLHDSSGVAADTTYTIPGGMGEATIRAYTGVPLPNATATRTTKNGAVPFRSFTTDVTVDVSDGSNTNDWTFQLRSYNPVLGGDLLAMYNIHDPWLVQKQMGLGSGVIARGDIRVQGRAVFWDSLSNDFLGTGSALTFEELLLPNNINGAVPLAATGNIMPLNYPIPRQTMGITSSSPSYDGELDIVNSATNSHNDYASRLFATGLSRTLDGGVAQAFGPGVDTRPDGPDDDTLEADIATLDTATLLTTLPASYPLSSRVLQAIADKNNVSFTADELYDIYKSHIPIPNDALSYLTGTHAAKIGPRAVDLHNDNGTAVHSDGNNKIEVFLDRTALPHLILTAAHDVVFHGQNDAAEATAAASLDPRAIAIDNNEGNSIHTLQFSGENGRRIVVAVSTEIPPGNVDPIHGFEAEVAFTSPNAFPVWNMILELENTAALIDTSAVSTAYIVGGIRGAMWLNVSSGTLTLQRQYDYTDYETLLSRNAWIEAYKN